MNWTIGVLLLIFAIIVLTRLAQIERRVVRLQRWIEMHAEPAPQASEEKLGEQRRLRLKLGYSAEEIESQIADERRWSSRRSLAQYVVNLKGRAKFASQTGDHLVASEYLIEARKLEEGEK